MLIKTIKMDDLVMKALGITTINRVICNTNKGVLTLQIRQGEKNYHLVLDAVPLEKDVNKELMAILFPAPVSQEVPKVNKEPQVNYSAIPGVAKAIMDNETKPKKKRGRPKGSKNK